MYFDSEGVTIYYHTIGIGTPVILIHGFTADFNYNWQAVAQLLSTHFQVIGMDVRGHGQSGKPCEKNAYGLEMVRDVVRLMDHIGIQKAHVVGYSMGGMIALKMASLYPERLYSAVLGGNGIFEEAEFFKIKAEHTVWLQKAIDENIPAMDAMLPDPSKMPDALIPLYHAMKAIDNDPSALLCVVGSLSDLAVSKDEAARIKPALLAIAGDRDDPFNTLQRLKKYRPDTNVMTLPGLDHVTTPFSAVFHEAIQKFLKTHERS